MEIHQIRYFLAVCEALNFTRAAQISNVTQPALSRAIRRLEEEMGGLLFRRARNAVAITDLGALVRPHLEEVLAHAGAAKSNARQFLKLEKAPLRVGVMCTVGPLRFNGFLARFRQRNPGIELSLLDGRPQHLLGLVRDGALDVAIVAQPEPYGPDLATHALYRERFVVACPAGHRFAGLAAVPIAQVAGESYLSRVNCEYADRLDAICRDLGFEVTEVYSTDREDWIQIMVMAGLGISFMPEFLPVVQGLTTRPVAEPAVVRTVTLVTAADRAASAPAQAFIDAIRAAKWAA